MIAVWYGTPCQTLSSARKFDGRGPPPLRDCRDPIQPASYISEKERQKVADANSLIDFTLEGIVVGHEIGVAFVLENPARSKLWELE